MAGHSKWAQIKRKKAVNDGVRSKIFGKYARLITVESRYAKGDTQHHRLKTVIERAKSENMPKDAIARAVARGVSTDAAALESVLYELYGPGGTALLVSTITDSRNRTVAELRHLLSKEGYELAPPGAALWAFTHHDGLYVPTSLVSLSTSDEILLKQLLELLDTHDDVQAVYTNAE